MPETQIRHLRSIQFPLPTWWSGRNCPQMQGWYICRQEQKVVSTLSCCFLDMEKPHLGKQRANKNLPLRNRRQLLYKQTCFGSPGMCNPASPLGFSKSLNLSGLFEAFKSCLHLLQPLLVSARWDIAGAATIPQGIRISLPPSTAQQSFSISFGDKNEGSHLM